jgi:hypothetical protein
MLWRPSTHAADPRFEIWYPSVDTCTMIMSACGIIGFLLYNPLWDFNFLFIKFTYYFYKIYVLEIMWSNFIWIFGVAQPRRGFAKSKWRVVVCKRHARVRAVCECQLDLRCEFRTNIPRATELRWRMECRAECRVSPLALRVLVNLTI